ncbi:MAG: hypothetical protein JNM09_06835 [Blastocatellia bacterium]|nr:hypothetical protein [Blastocatellia bacterium]
MSAAVPILKGHEEMNDTNYNPTSVFANDPYQRLLDHLRDGNACWRIVLILDNIPDATLEEAIQRGDAVAEGQFNIRASSQLLARLQAEALQAQMPAETLNKPEVAQASEDASTEQDCEPVQAKKPSPRAFAAQWLRDLLQQPRWVEDIHRWAQEDGISLTTLKRAKKSIGAKSVKIGGYFGGEDTRWFWRLG